MPDDMYRWIDHTGELELQLEAPTEQGVLAEALAALAELLAEHSETTEGAPAAHSVTASAQDRPTLLAEWLSELVYLVETERFLPLRVDALELSDDQLEATVSGRLSSPPHLVKAVTYHRLAMVREADAWRATVVLDV